MKKYILAFFMFTITGLLAACNVLDIQKSKQDKKVNENNDEIIYEGSENEWELSPTFEHSVIYEDGEKGSYTVVGSTDRVGFTGSFPIIAKEPQKYFWFYFGRQNIYDKPVKVKAIKKETKEVVDVLSGPSTFYKSAAVSPGSVNMPSLLTFPSAGIWKVLVYIDEKLYESIVIEVV